jgi:hypothetical protein
MTLSERPEKDIDPELFHHVVMSVKNIAVARPQHIAQYSYDDIGCKLPSTYSNHVLAFKRFSISLIYLNFV